MEERVARVGRVPVVTDLLGGGAVGVLDDEHVLERHVPLHVGRVERRVLAAGGRALVRHPRLMFHLRIQT